MKNKLKNKNYKKRKIFKFIKKKENLKVLNKQEILRLLKKIQYKKFLTCYKKNSIKFPKILSNYKYIKLYSFFQKLNINNFLIIKSKMQNYYSIETLSMFSIILSIKSLLKIFLNLKKFKKKHLIHILIKDNKLYKFTKFLFNKFKLFKNLNIKLYNSLATIKIKKNNGFNELFLILGDLSIEIYKKIKILNYNLIYTINLNNNNTNYQQHTYLMHHKFNDYQKAFMFFTILYKFLKYSAKNKKLKKKKNHIFYNFLKTKKKIIKKLKKEKKIKKIINKNIKYG